MKERLSKVIWTGIPGTRCNLNCSYCYVGEKEGKKGEYLYSTDHMLECFKPERFGGPIFFEATGSGETLLWDEIIPFTAGMLSYGHIVSYTTNMTIKPMIEALCNFSSDQRSRLVLDASLHYLELKRKKLLGTFFENLRMLKSAGISIAILVCVSDTYIPHLREISDICQKEVGLLPIAGMARTYDANGGRLSEKYSQDVEKLVRETCDVRQWELQRHIYGYKRKEFCHAGECSIDLNLGTGDYTKCWGNSGLVKKWQRFLSNGRKLSKTASFIYNKFTARLFDEPSQVMGNIFRDPTEPIKFEPMGRCPFYDCICASFLCWGLIPELDVGTHAQTYFAKQSVSNKVWDLTNSKITPSSTREKH